MTIIMVTHNPALSDEFHRVVRLRDGQVADRLPEEEMAVQS